MKPRRVRRSSPPYPERTPLQAPGAGRADALVALLLALVVTACAGAAACGGSSGASSTSPSPLPTAGSAPLAGSLQEAAAAYWRLMDANDFAAVAAAGVPGERPSATAATDDMLRVRLLSAEPLSHDADGPGSALVQATIFVDPTKDPLNPSPWGTVGNHTVFMDMQKAPEGGWLIRHWGTSP